MFKKLFLILSSALLLNSVSISPVWAEGWCNLAQDPSLINTERPAECEVGVSGLRWIERCTSTGTILRFERQDGSCGANSAIGNPTGAQDVIGVVTPPTQLLNLTLGGFIVTVVQLIFAVGGLVFLFMILLGSFQWITSGGDKEAVAKARQRIVNA